MVGVLGWLVDLGRVDTILETALMYLYLALTRRGHLKHVFHMFGYLKANLNINICFDTQNPTIDDRSFAANNWYDLYRDYKESIPEDDSTPKVNVVSTHFFVDADYAGDRDTRRS